MHVRRPIRVAKNATARALVVQPDSTEGSSQMEFALILRELARRRRMVAIGVLVAAIAAVLSVYRLEGLKLKSALAAALQREHPGARGFAVVGSWQPLAVLRTARGARCRFTRTS